MNVFVPTLILSAMGILFGLALAFASKAFAVKADARAAEVREVLPGANCAACGYTGCDGYAAAVVSGEAAPNLCSVGGQATAEKIGAILGLSVGAVERRVARVKCAGTSAVCGTKYDYEGIADCAAARLVHDGPSACGYGCLGFGNCVKACAYGAIFVRDGVAEVVASRCTACGMCAAACPKKLIELLPVDANYTVRCANMDRGAVTRKNCAVGCIGCMRCVKVCSIGAISVKNNLASIDQDKCRRCGECVKVCPQKCINYYDCLLTREKVG
ncbi:MAG: RnfABCDGE type electron transport complex subunit B [Clostridiales bacterium]|jgi:Na+-translocating ferredoxin:NAD+ oxidoreductase RNF subunit RnfB|nr:RnfABCDGE type electron transport complex subunit B [Clostridiales bacterium]